MPAKHHPNRTAPPAIAGAILATRRAVRVAATLTIAIAAATPLTAAGLPTPVIHAGVEDGSSRIRGSLSLPANGAANTLKVFVNNSETPPQKVLLELTRGEFEILLSAPLKGGDRVQVQHFAAGDLSSDKSPAIRVPATPSVEGRLEDGATKVAVRAVAGASGVVVVVTDSADKERTQTKRAGVPAECGTDASKCLVEVAVAALAEGDRVRVQEPDGPLSQPSKVLAKAAQPFTATINSVEAYYGSQKVKVLFERLPDKVETASIKLSTCWEVKQRPFTADERKANSIEVALDRGLFCYRPEEVKNLEVEIVTQTKGDSKAQSAKKPYEVLIPRLTLDPPLREGDGVITGRANAGVPKIRVQVYSGWQLEPLSDQDRENELAKTRKELGAAKDGSIRKARLEREVKSLQHPEQEMAEVLVASSPAEQRAVQQCRKGELVTESEEQALSDGRFSVTLDQRLNAGECAIAIAVFAQAAPVTPDRPLEAVVASRAEIVRSVILDWGRLRGYFSLGGAVSHYRDRFSQVDSFIGFTADARVVGKALDKKSPQGPMALRTFRWQINFFTDSRVSVRLANTGTPAGNGAAPAAQKPAQPITDPRLSYSTDQPGYFLGAIHVPVSFKGMDWRHAGEQYSFFFGPIARLGGQTQSEDTVVFRHLEVKPGSDPRTFTVKREDTRAGVLPTWGYGARLGIFKYDLLAGTKRASVPQQRQVANDLIGYLDFTWGKSYAYRSYRYASTVNGIVSKTDNYLFIADPKLTDIEISSTVRKRLMIEGRLKIPTLPALIGVDLGVRTNSSDFEPNQLRFVVAFRIDAQKALGRIFGEGITRTK